MPSPIDAHLPDAWTLRRLDPHYGQAQPAHVYAPPGVLLTTASLTPPALPMRLYLHNHAHGAPCWPGRCSWVDQVPPPRSDHGRRLAVDVAPEWVALLYAARHQAHKGGVCDRLRQAIDALAAYQ